MSFLRERFEKIFGGSIQLSGNNVPITFIGDCDFINNFGATGAALNFNRGGGLYLRDSNFFLESKVNSQTSDWSLPDADPQAELELIYETAMIDIYTTYNSRLSQSYLFEREMFDKLKSTQNTNGQVYIKQT